MEAVPKEVFYYQTISANCPCEEWLEFLRDQKEATPCNAQKIIMKAL